MLLGSGAPTAHAGSPGAPDAPGRPLLSPNPLPDAPAPLLDAGAGRARIPTAVPRSRTSPSRTHTPTMTERSAGAIWATSCLMR